MSILIKGLHKPDKNHSCPFVDAEYGYCLVDLGITGRGEKCEYMKECPLIELPDHGRLIDADKLKESHCVECTLYPDRCLGDNCDWSSIYHLDHAPTVIPAERSEE